jgi:ATP-dependent DNA ligase
VAAHQTARTILTEIHANALHSGKHNEEVQLCAFDVLAMDGDDLRSLPLSMRKANLGGCWHAGRMGSSS